MPLRSGATFFVRTGETAPAVAALALATGATATARHRAIVRAIARLPIGSTRVR